MSKQGKHHVGKKFGTPFEKGQSGNPSGSSKRSKEMAAIKKLTQHQFAETASKIITMDIAEMQALSKDPNANVLDAIFAKVLTRAYEHGNTSDLNYFVERCMGKVADNVNIAGNMHGSLMTFLEGRNGGKDERQEKDISPKTQKIGGKKG